MELKIGNKKYEAIKITADFPLRFYKETGKDLFLLETSFESNFLESYDSMLHLAYALSGEKETFEDFQANFTPRDLIDAYANIFECYSATSTSEVESKTEKKQQ